LIVLAELLIFFGHTEAAMAVHGLNLIAIALSTSYLNDRVYQSLLLLPLFRLLNAAMPVFFTLTLYSYSFIYAPMYLSMFLMLRQKKFSYNEIGLTSKGLLYYLPLGIAVGLAIGWGEYQVIHPEILTPERGIWGILLLSFIMIFFVGLVEEFVFRSMLQTVLIERYGTWMGLFIASALFGFMHGGYRVPTEILFTFIAGLAFGIMFLKTLNLPFITVAHGVTNVSLFLIVPAYPELLLPAIAFFGLLGTIIAIISTKCNIRMKISPQSRRSVEKLDEIEFKL
jgi:uncharacterized protein